MTDYEEREWPLCKDEFPNILNSEGVNQRNLCEARTESGPGGGIRCPKCGEWFCY